MARSRLRFPFAREVPIKRDAPLVAAADRPWRKPSTSSMAPTSISSAPASQRPMAARRSRTSRSFAARPHKLAVEFRQSNHEGEIVDLIHEAAAKKAAGIIINAGAYTHTSVAIRDAVAAVAVPVIEVHISNVFAREGFRHHSRVAPVAKASLCGFGVGGYALAIDGLAALIGARRKSSKP